MYINNITIENFKIYHGLNRLDFSPQPPHNVSIICGDNGHGKTTLLTALVWCLYGKHIQEIDNTYRDKITAAGSYGKYLSSLMNRLALSNGEREFQVRISFKDISLIGIDCNTLEIERKCNTENWQESLSITVDNAPSELVDEFGQQTFIHDFILPRDIAKFFFFDAEKIVEIAEIKSIQDTKKLSEAYLDVLGIKKYEDLKNNLEDLRLKYRKASANKQERGEFNAIGREIDNLGQMLAEKEASREMLINEKGQLLLDFDKVQERLIQGGISDTPSEIAELRNKREEILKIGHELRIEFRDLLDYAPFAIASKQLSIIEKQLYSEYEHDRLNIDKTTLSQKIEKIISQLNQDSNKNAEISNSIKAYYENEVRLLLSKHLISNGTIENDTQTKTLHEFTREQRNRFDAIVNNLRTSFKVKLNDLHRGIKKNRSEYNNLNKQLRESTKAINDEITLEYQEQKEYIDNKIQEIDSEMVTLSQAIGSIGNQITSKKHLYEQLSQRVNIHTQYKEKDNLASRLIEELTVFINTIKTKKKHQLQKKVLTNLSLLMNKKDLIHNVEIIMDNGYFDVQLFGKHQIEISKDDLSKGEQQLYATALLHAMVEESGLNFPIFIDSPLQKFDDRHSRNIISRFYPNIASQVVILPILNRELGLDEYNLLSGNVDSLYLIDNVDQDSSAFIPLTKESLLKEYKKRAPLG